MELSKKDKKVVRKIIEIGLQREFEKGLSGFDDILKDWKDAPKQIILLYILSKIDKHFKYNGLPIF